MPKSLTELERRVLDYIVEYLRRNTYQPSIREIGREFSIKSTKTVSELLHSLAVKGWIERDPSRSRGVRLLGVEMTARTVSVPVFEASETALPTGHYEFDRKLIPTSGAYLVRLAGDHLLEEGMRSGDLLLVEPVDALALEAGDIVLITLAGATVPRRCAPGDGGLVLEPIRSGEVALSLGSAGIGASVQGRVTSVIRQLRPASIGVPVAAESRAV